MEELKIKGRAIYTTKGAAREYGRVGCNFYKGCPHGCEYCYLKRGAPSKQLGGNTAELKKCFKDETHALEVFRKEVKKHVDVLKTTGVFFSFTTDPLIPETSELTLSAAEIAINSGVPVKILTKCAKMPLLTALWPNYFRTDRRHMLSFGWTLTGRDDMEPKASSNLERIEAMRRIKKLGYQTWASIEPVIDWQHANMVVEMSLDCCDHYKIGLRSGVKKDYYDLVGSGMWLDELTKKITAAGRTVYLKKSARRLLSRCYDFDHYKEIMLRTVDVFGISYKTTNAMLDAMGIDSRLIGLI